MIVSVVPACHKFRVNGKNLYAWCAADALFLPKILNATAEIESQDPVTGDLIRLTATPNGVSGFKPGTYFSLVGPGMVPEAESKAAGIDGSLCSHIDFSRT